MFSGTYSFYKEGSTELWSIQRGRVDSFTEWRLLYGSGDSSTEVETRLRRQETRLRREKLVYEGERLVYRGGLVYGEERLVTEGETLLINGRNKNGKLAR
jgi:hypothetical protein